MFLFLLAWLSCTSEPIEHTVVRGDTLGKLAKTHGVTVEELLAWNDLNNDRIQVGQVLVVGRGGGKEEDPVALEPESVAKASKPKKRRSKGGAVKASTVTSTASSLVMPPAKACLQGPTDADAQGTEAGFASSQGLSHGQVKGGMDRALPGLSVCVSGAWPVGRAELEITAGCDGRVSSVRTVDDGGLEPGLLGCVRERLGYAEFPAHDLPDGETFVYPLVFSE
ncbi:MAG: murein DD-endopeptidase MepM/ murein hydrolase activator NlpD [Cognaticolwellia sp.]|jgi:murein DD-endopeptidase MepM/ murein hydrolase activator NlpD